MNEEMRVRSTTTLRERGQITIPSEVREAVHVEPGAVLECHVEDGRIIMTPKVLIDADQAWFWAPQWQEKERDVDLAVADGRTEVFESFEDFVADLES